MQQTKLQYFLEVKNNQILTEEGNFFPAIPFKIIFLDQELKIYFKKGKAGKVVYQVTQNDEILEELTYPDYVKEIKKGIYTEIEDLDEKLLITSIALVKLGIIKEKNYLKKLSLENYPEKKSFVIEQEFLI